MEYLSALKKSVVAGLMIGIGCTVFLNRTIQSWRHFYSD